MRNEVKLANPNYDSSKIEEFKNVWVFCEQRQGQMMSTSYEPVSYTHLTLPTILRV